MKRCPFCHRTLEIAKFGNNKAKRDGKDYLCKECKNKRAYKNKSLNKTKEVDCLVCKKKFFKNPKYIYQDKNWCSFECIHEYSRKGTRAINGKKRCSKCLLFKSISEYNISRRNFDGFNSQCRLCVRKVKAKRMFNLSAEEVAALSPVCEICGSNKILCIDHDHKTGEIRGTLCKKHNVCLGLLEDNIVYFEKYISYLKKH